MLRDDVVVLFQRISLYLSANFRCNATREKVGDVVQAFADGADLPVNQREVVLSVRAEEHIVQPEIAVHQGHRPGRGLAHLVGDSGAVCLGQPARIVGKELSEVY